MKAVDFQISVDDKKLILKFFGTLNLHHITSVSQQIDKVDFRSVENVIIDLDGVEFIDTAFAIFLQNLKKDFRNKSYAVSIVSSQKEVQDTLNLAISEDLEDQKDECLFVKQNLLHRLGVYVYDAIVTLFLFFNFLGQTFSTALLYFKSTKNIRVKEIVFEVNESGLKALPIIALTSFLIGLVVAYQSAYQLKLYGANIFLVDMLGISILRELAPLITAIVIAGRSGSAFTAQIGAMKITEELDAMRTMGFDPYLFLVMPRIIALIITMIILIFVADIMGIVGGMLVANIDLAITPTLFLERFLEVVDVKHFFVGMVKAPFFAFLIATIAIYRGFVVKDDTQSIGFNTTKSVVESIFAVIMCDALFSIAFTNLGI